MTSSFWTLQNPHNQLEIIHQINQPPDLSYRPHRQQAQTACSQLHHEQASSPISPSPASPVSMLQQVPQGRLRSPGKTIPHLGPPTEGA